MNLDDYTVGGPVELCVFELYSKENKEMKTCGEVAREFWIPGFEEKQPLCDEHARFVLECRATGEIEE